MILINFSVCLSNDSNRNVSVVFHVAIIHITRVCFVILVDTFGIADSDIYLMHDELDKVLGKCVIKEGGSARYKLWILQVSFFLL